MNTISSLRGMHDMHGEGAKQHRFITTAMQQVAALYHAEEIATPVVEYTEVFARSLGDTSDVVTKEMYTFQDRNGESLTLRPEGTAGIMRAVLSNKWQQKTPLRLWYSGAMFRYERPQKGRQRQFHQVGTEFIGEASPHADAEAICMAVAFLKAVGVSATSILEINTLGDEASRAVYKQALVEYLQQYATDLSEDSQKRLQRNPLRILDSKEEKDQNIIADAPKLADFLTEEAGSFFQQVQQLLESAGVSFKVSNRLVRGLDYYSHTVFEFVATGLGAQATVLAGGRYNKLSTLLGAKEEIPSVGWAAGVERLALLLPPVQYDENLIAVLAIGKETATAAFQVAQRLRLEQGLPAIVFYGENPSKLLKKAVNKQAKFAFLLGEDELKSNTITIKNLLSGNQHTIKLENISNLVNNLI